MAAGFRWLASAGSANQVKEAQSMIWAALSGLSLALFSYLILNTINPNLTALKPLEIAQITAVSATKAQADALNNYITQDEDIIRKRLASAGITIADNKPPCQTGETTNCVNLVGLPKEAIVGLSKLKILMTQAGLNSPNNIQITGGTEDGHSSHGVNMPIVDLRVTPQLSSYIGSTGTQISVPGFGVEAYKIGNDLYVRETNPDHWHVEFGDPNHRLQ
jgi:hypothetical protein